MFEIKYFIYAVHIPGVDNLLADSLSRFQWNKFRELAPGAKKEGVPCPDWIWELPLESPRDGFGSLSESTWSAYAKVWKEWSGLVQEAGAGKMGSDGRLLVLYFVARNIEKCFFGLFHR